MKDDIAVIYGRHAVVEALRHRPDIVRVVHVTDEVREEIFASATEHGITLKVLNAKKLLPDMPKDAVHQGFAAEIDVSKLLWTYEDFMRAHEVTNDTALVILGEVQDPHNVGAVIRSATAFGVAAVLIPEHRQAQINGTIIKVSVGTAFRIPLIQIGNINQTLENLKERGFWAYGLTHDAEQPVSEEAFEKPSVIVLGNEAEGIRLKTLEHCDILLRIPMSPRAESLNASAAAAIVLHAWSAHHPKALAR